MSEHAKRRESSDPGCDTLAELVPELPRIMRKKGWLRPAALIALRGVDTPGRHLRP
jgi:hypothetical protein